MVSTSWNSLSIFCSFAIHSDQSGSPLAVGGAVEVNSEQHPVAEFSCVVGRVFCVLLRGCVTPFESAGRCRGSHQMSNRCSSSATSVGRRKTFGSARSSAAAEIRSCAMSSIL